jgi:hypothetical protein
MQESVPARPGQGSSLFPIAMGILDEAIRQHLELKRKRGATDSELQRLEDEAFGPPSRPGEPDFPEHEDEAAEQSGNGVAHEGAVAESPGLPEAPIAPPAEGEPAEVEPAVEAAEETVEQPPPGEGPQAESSSEQAEPPADVPPGEDEAETAIYDQTVQADPELSNLDLEPTEEGPSSDEPPIETLDTVEHALPEEDVEQEAPQSGEPGPEPAEELQPLEEEPGPESEEDETSAEGEPEDEEDVLADTPEFLKDAPEDDELWFEQGKPKDFDF